MPYNVILKSYVNVNQIDELKNQAFDNLVCTNLNNDQSRYIIFKI